VGQPDTPATVVSGSPDSVDGVVALLRAKGGRATPSRRVLLEVLFETDQHLTAEELATAVQQRLPDAHLSTIYRNLEELEKLGVVAHSHLGHGPVAYQLASHSHAHLICNACGARIGISDELFEDLADKAEAQYGFAIDPHHFAIFGLCAQCRSDG
jgi:Fur family ferric uptake transcriptional regulator